MLGKITGLASALLIGHLWSATAVAQWEPPAEFSREEIVKISGEILSMPGMCSAELLSRVAFS